MIGAIELKLNGHAGFLYHHTCDEVPVPLMNDIRIADSISQNRSIYLQQQRVACMKNKKLLISSCIFVLLFAVTFGILFLTYSVDDLLLCLKMIKSTFYLIIGIAIIMFFTLEAIYFKIIFKSLDENISFRRCMHYSFVEFFFSGITPGSTGGQPVQLYYMNKDKIPMKKSMIALILNTILFKLFFIVTGILIIIFKFNYISMSKTVVKVLFFIGLTYDIVAIIFCLLLMYNQKLILVVYIK